MLQVRPEFHKVCYGVCWVGSISGGACMDLLSVVCNVCSFATTRPDAITFAAVVSSGLTDGVCLVVCLVVHSPVPGGGKAKETAVGGVLSVRKSTPP